MSTNTTDTQSDDTRGLTEEGLVEAARAKMLDANERLKTGRYHDAHELLVEASDLTQRLMEDHE